MRKNISNLLLTVFIFQLLLTGIYARKEQKAELVVQTGHSDSADSVVFSPNGKLLASGSEDRKINTKTI